jgi:hypothetical protein
MTRRPRTALPWLISLLVVFAAFAAGIGIYAAARAVLLAWWPWLLFDAD